MNRFVGLTIAALIWLFAAHAALAQGQNCGPRDAAIALLTEKYGETAQGGGFSGPTGTVFMTYANLQTGSWSVIEIRPDGLTCLRASGEMYRRLDETPLTGDPT